jgi:CheY-like chemotaxis protein
MLPDKETPMNVAKHPTVMVAENYDDTRCLLKFWLESEGYRVVEAANGREAFELTGDQCPDLLLMSLRMPVLDGFEATRLIRERGQECVFPIVAISTYPTQRERASALAAGCSEFILEPIDFGGLSDLLSHLLPHSAGQHLQASS